MQKLTLNLLAKFLPFFISCVGIIGCDSRGNSSKPPSLDKATEKQEDKETTNWTRDRDSETQRAEERKAYEEKVRQANHSEAQYDPEQARIILRKNGLMQSYALDGADILVPTIYVKEFSYSSHIQLLRCHETYKAESATGTPLENLDFKKQLDRNALMWIWQNAARSPNSCRLVGKKISRKTINDLAAPSGSYFYLINPCISGKYSETKEEVCNFNLTKTETIKHEAMFQGLPVAETFAEKAEELNDIENELSEAFIGIIVISRRIQRDQQQCLDDYYEKLAKKSFWKGLSTLVAMGVGTAVGTIIAGPIVGLKAGDTAAGLVRGIFGDLPKDLKCPAVDQHMNEAVALSEELDLLNGEVFAIRSDLQELVETFRSGNDMIQEDFIEGSDKF